MDISRIRNNYKLLEKAIWIIALPFLLFISSLRPFALLFVIIWMIFRPVISGQKWRRTSLDIPILLIFITSLISIFTSIDVISSVYKFFQLLMYIALFYTVVNHIERENELRQLVSLALLVATLLSLVAIISYIVPFIGPYLKFKPLNQLVNLLMNLRIKLLDPGLGYQNSLAGFILFLLPVAFTLSIWGKWKKQHFGRYAILFAFFIMLTIPFITSSRGAVYALSMAFLSILIIKKPKIGLSLLIFLVFISIWFLPQIQNYFYSDFTFIARTYIWKSSIEMIRQFPFTGVGYGVYEIAYSYFLFPGSAQYTPFSRHAHNIFLQPAAETGILTMFIFIWLIFLILKESLLLIKRTAGYQQALSIGLFCSFIAFIFQGLIDSVNSGVRLGMLFWLMISIVFSLSRVNKGDYFKSEHNQQRLIKKVFGLRTKKAYLLPIILFTVIFGYNFYSFGSLLFNNVGNIFLYRSLNSEIIDKRKIDLKNRAVIYYQKAIDLPRSNYQPHKNLAKTYLDLGQTGKAFSELQQAQKIKSNDTFIHLYLANVYEYQGKKRLAKKEMRKSKEIAAGTFAGRDKPRIRWGIIN